MNTETLEDGRSKLQTISTLSKSLHLLEVLLFHMSTWNSWFSFGLSFKAVVWVKGGIEDKAFYEREDTNQRLSREAKRISFLASSFLIFKIFPPGFLNKGMWQERELFPFPLPRRPCGPHQYPTSISFFFSYVL